MLNCPNKVSMTEVPCMYFILLSSSNRKYRSIDLRHCCHIFYGYVSEGVITPKSVGHVVSLHGKWGHCISWANYRVYYDHVGAFSMRSRYSVLQSLSCYLYKLKKIRFIVWIHRNDDSSGEFCRKPHTVYSCLQ